MSLVVRPPREKEWLICGGVASRISASGSVAAGQQRAQLSPFNPPIGVPKTCHSIQARRHALRRSGAGTKRTFAAQTNGRLFSGGGGVRELGIRVGNDQVWPSADRQRKGGSPQSWHDGCAQVSPTKLWLAVLIVRPQPAAIRWVLPNRQWWHMLTMPPPSRLGPLAMCPGLSRQGWSSLAPRRCERTVDIPRPRPA